MPTYAILLTSTSIPRSLTIAIHPWLLAEGGRIWSFMSEGTDGLEEEQIPILFVDVCDDTGTELTYYACESGGSEDRRRYFTMRRNRHV